MLFTWFILAGFIFLLTPQKLANKFQFAFARIFSWPLSIGRNISLSARAQNPPADVVSRREYNKLQNHLTNVIEDLLLKQQKLEKLSGLYDRLYALEGANLMVADVITASINGSRNELIINRGKMDGLAEGQFVLGDNSIIGTISNVSSHTARVKLITDSTSTITVKIAELNVDRLMQGKDNNSAKVQLLSIKHKIKTGDIIYASKKPGFLDAPMIIATVAQCKRDDDNPSLWDITVKPACDVERLSDVAVIVMNPRK
jgi:rod shape-determining protein MreC